MSEITSFPEKPLQRVFMLGAWKVDPELNQLTELDRPTNTRSLEPRLMHLLCFLAANPGRVLSREQLTAELWPRVIVNENSLTRAVSDLRKNLTLGDQAADSFLQTIPKRGYRLVGSVQPLRQTSSQPILLPVGEIAPGPAAVLAWRRPLQVAAVLLLAILAISFDYPATTTELPALAEAPLLFYDQVVEERPSIIGGQLSPSALIAPGSHSRVTASDESSALSPDGSVLALLRHEGDLSRIYLNKPGSDREPVAIFSSSDYLYNLSWSPVGNALLFAREPASMIPTSLRGSRQVADLLMLDLDTLSLQILIDNSSESRVPAAV